MPVKQYDFLKKVKIDLCLEMDGYFDKLDYLFVSD